MCLRDHPKENYLLTSDVRSRSQSLALRGESWPLLHERRVHRCLGEAVRTPRHTDPSLSDNSTWWRTGRTMRLASLPNRRAAPQLPTANHRQAVMAKLDQYNFCRCSLKSTRTPPKEDDSFPASAGAASACQELPKPLATKHEPSIAGVA